MAKDLAVIAHPSAAAFLARAEPWLLAAEAENNLILGIAGRLRDGANPYGEPVSLITVEGDGQVLGCAWRTPPFNLGLTHLPAAAIALLIEQVAGTYPELPGVTGPTAETEAAAALWAARSGQAIRGRMALEIHALHALLPLARPVPGHASRSATARGRGSGRGGGGRGGPRRR
jgi:hypothetical protein